MGQPGEGKSSGKGKWLKGRDLAAVAFPLGGIGTGTISLGGRGNLRDWEIFNRPGKGVDIGPALFALWCRPAGGQAVARVLEGEPRPPFMDRHLAMGGHGMPRHQFWGLPRFRKVRFRGQYPFAWLKLRDEDVPLDVVLEAFNPMIPLEQKDSSIPAAIFNWNFTNRGDVPVELSLAVVLRNPVGHSGPLDVIHGRNYLPGNLNEFIHTQRLAGLRMSNAELAAGDPRLGTLALATPHANVSVQTRWYRDGAWWDDAHLFWDDFADDGRVEQVSDSEPSSGNTSDVCDLLLHATVAPGASVTMPVVLTWHFANRLRRDLWSLPQDEQTTLGNWYTTCWPDAWAVAEYVVDEMKRLTERTRAWHTALYDSTLPRHVLEAAGAGASIARTASCLQLADGSFHAFEGCSDAKGCCPMNCTHVWDYAQAVAWLWPALERSVRETDFVHNMGARGHEGSMAFRTILPTSEEQVSGGAMPGGGLWDKVPAADGQMGTIMRACREWRLSGDGEWLARIWPGVRRAIEFAWRGEDGQGRNAWDPDKRGVLLGSQHNTYDIEFFGPNPLTAVLYLGALRAAAVLARAMGENEPADEYEAIAQRGRAWLDENLFDAELGYYVQVIDTEGWPVPAELVSPDGTPKYQVGRGCLSDQLLGQFLAHACGLGPLLDQARVRRAMRSIYENNFRERLGEHGNVQRVYGLGPEGGLLLCTWPGGDRPQLPFVYCDEVWTGVEYQVAGGLIWEGAVKEGLRVVKAARGRYTGHNRNPWNEVECGHHYVRAMAIWGVLLALSGHRCDAAAGTMGFRPAFWKKGSFRSVYTTGKSWGRVEMTREEGGLSFRLRVDHGRQELAELELGGTGVAPTSVIATSGANAVSRVAGDTVVVSFQPSVQLDAGECLELRLT